MAQRALTLAPKLQHRGVLAGSAIAAGFGVAWALFGASGLPSPAEGAVSVVALIVGVVIIGRTLRLRRQAPPDSAPVVRSHAFWVVVAVEVVAIAVGIPALTLSGHGKYVAPWVAAVVGLHFLAFGRLIGRFWYPVGAVLLAGAAAGAAVGATGAGVDAVEAISGLIASATLLTASGYRALAPRGPR